MYNRVCIAINIQQYVCGMYAGVYTPVAAVYGVRYGAASGVHAPIRLYPRCVKLGYYAAAILLPVNLDARRRP